MWPKQNARPIGRAFPISTFYFQNSKSTLVNRPEFKIYFWINFSYLASIVQYLGIDKIWG